MEQFRFTERSDGTYSLKIYSDGGAITAAVRVPSEYDGKPVTELTFGEKTDANFQSLTIPETVREIVFNDDFPFAVKNIFAAELIVDGSNPSYRTDGKALYSKDGKQLYRLLPRYIEEYEVLPGTEIITTNAFEGLENLGRLFLPEGLRKINALAFSGCRALTELYIPSTVRNEAWRDPGHDLVSFTGYVVAPANPFFRSENGVVYSRDMTTLIGAPTVMPERFIVPQSVRRIGDEAFIDRAGPREIVLPESCTAIDYSFIRCRRLEKINLENVRAMDPFAFNNCTSLRSVELHCDKVPLGAFNGCSELSEARLDCAEIDREAFIGCRELTTVTFSERTKTIGEEAFDNCTALRKLTLPDGLSAIGGKAFCKCPLENVIVPKTVKSVGEWAFGRARKVTVYDTLRIRDNFMWYADSVFSPDRELIVKSAETDNVLYKIWTGYKREDMDRFNKIMRECFTENGFDFDLADSTFNELSDVLTKAYYAYYRLTNPHPPSPVYAKEFAVHLRTEGLTIAVNCIIEKRSELIMRLADYILTLRNITPIVGLTTKQGMTELTAFLLDYRNKHLGTPLDDLKLE